MEKLPGISRLQKTIDAQTAKLDRLSRSLVLLRTNPGANTPTGLESRVEALENEVDSLANDHILINQRLDALESGSSDAGLAVRVTALETDLSNLTTTVNQNITDIQLSQANQDTAIQANAADLLLVEGTDLMQDGSIADLTARVAVLEANPGGGGGGEIPADIEERLTAIEGRIDQVEGEIVAINQILSAMDLVRQRFVKKAKSYKSMGSTLGFEVYDATAHAVPVAYPSFSDLDFEDLKFPYMPHVNELTFAFDSLSHFHKKITIPFTYPTSIAPIQYGNVTLDNYDYAIYDNQSEQIFSGGASTIARYNQETEQYELERVGYLPDYELLVLPEEMVITMQYGKFSVTTNALGSAEYTKTWDVLPETITNNPSGLFMLTIGLEGVDDDNGNNRIKPRITIGMLRDDMVVDQNLELNDVPSCTFPLVDEPLEMTLPLPSSAVYGSARVQVIPIGAFTHEDTADVASACAIPGYNPAFAARDAKASFGSVDYADATIAGLDGSVAFYDGPTGSLADGNWTLSVNGDQQTSFVSSVNGVIYFDYMNSQFDASEVPDGEYNSSAFNVNLSNYTSPSVSWYFKVTDGQVVDERIEPYFLPEVEVDSINNLSFTGFTPIIGPVEYPSQIWYRVSNMVSYYWMAYANVYVRLQHLARNSGVLLRRLQDKLSTQGEVGAMIGHLTTQIEQNSSAIYTLDQKTVQLKSITFGTSAELSDIVIPPIDAETSVIRPQDGTINHVGMVSSKAGTLLENFDKAPNQIELTDDVNLYLDGLHYPFDNLGIPTTHSFAYNGVTLSLTVFPTIDLTKQVETRVILNSATGDIEYGAVNIIGAGYTTASNVDDRTGFVTVKLQAKWASVPGVGQSIIAPGAGKFTYYTDDGTEVAQAYPFQWEDIVYDQVNYQSTTQCSITIPNVLMARFKLNSTAGDDYTYTPDVSGGAWANTADVMVTNDIGANGFAHLFLGLASDQGTPNVYGGVKHAKSFSNEVPADYSPSQHRLVVVNPQEDETSLVFPYRFELTEPISLNFAPPVTPVNDEFYNPDSRALLALAIENRVRMVKLSAELNVVEKEVEQIMEWTSPSLWSSLSNAAFLAAGFMSGGTTLMVTMAIGTSFAVLDQLTRGEVGGGIITAITATLGGIFESRHSKNSSGTAYEEQAKDPASTYGSVIKYMKRMFNLKLFSMSEMELKASLFYKKMTARRTLDKEVQRFPIDPLIIHKDTTPEQAALYKPPPVQAASVSQDVFGTMMIQGDGVRETPLYPGQNILVKLRDKTSGPMSYFLNWFSHKATTLDHQSLRIRQPYRMEVGGKEVIVTIHAKIGIAEGGLVYADDDADLPVGNDVDMSDANQKENRGKPGMEMWMTYDKVSTDGKVEQVPITLNFMKEEGWFTASEGDLKKEKGAILYQGQFASAIGIHGRGADHFMLDPDGDPVTIDDIAAQAINDDFEYIPGVNNIPAGGREALLMTPDDFALISRWLEVPGGFRERWKYAFLNNNCGHFAKELRSLLSTGKTKNDAMPAGFVSDLYKSRAELDKTPPTPAKLAEVLRLHYDTLEKIAISQRKRGY